MHNLCKFNPGLHARSPSLIHQGQTSRSNFKVNLQGQNPQGQSLTLTLSGFARYLTPTNNVYPRLSRAVSPERNVSVGLFASWPTVELHRIIRSHIAIQLNDLEQSSHVRNVVDCNLLLAALGIISVSLEPYTGNRTLLERER